ncbi:MAG TPA: ABC transporter substrate binding protein [Chloroflexota bacterium]|nr:ABC transporter substrate binding protein [Chloroflexota bacterium]
MIEERWADSTEQFPALATELVGLPVDLIVAGGTVATQAAMSATSTIPIVFLNSGDPVQAGLVASLARPGGNMTGLSNQQAQTGGKRLQLLRDLVPGVSRVMFLTTVVAQTTGALQEAQALGLTIPDSVLAQATETIK